MPVGTPNAVKCDIHKLLTGRNHGERLFYILKMNKKQQPWDRGESNRQWTPGTGASVTLTWQEPLACVDIMVWVPALHYIAVPKTANFKKCGGGALPGLRFGRLWGMASASWVQFRRHSLSPCRQGGGACREYSLHGPAKADRPGLTVPASACPQWLSSSCRPHSPKFKLSIIMDYWEKDK